MIVWLLVFGSVANDMNIILSDELFRNAREWRLREDL
jgi:hypothetical protein